MHRPIIRKTKIKTTIMKRIKQFAVALIAPLMLIGNAEVALAQDVDRAKYPDYIAPDKIPQKLMPQSKSRGVAKSMNRGERPDHINNALSMYFPPVFNQSGGSCGSAQAIGYMFTHEMNSWRNLDASFEENQYPTHFTWLFTTAGTEKIHQMVNNGIPNVTTYGGRTYSNSFGYQVCDNADFGWMQGYDKWYSAMFNRSKEFFRGPSISENDDDGREQLKQWLWNRWGTEGYNDGGVAGFGVASGGIWGSIPSTPTNDAIGVSKMRCVAQWGHTYDHGLTICGYDDRIEFDLDSNGVVGEKDKDEVGAWIICNSWGSNWLNQGFVYCPYKHSYCMIVGRNSHSLNWATELYIHRPDFQPQRTIKLLMDYSHRWELCLGAGISQDTSATKPEAQIEFTHFNGSTNFDVDGVSPEVPMLGKWADGVHKEPMEFGYDLTDLGERFDRTKPLKYFFIVKTKANGIGSGHLLKASILNYEYDRNDPVEVPFKIEKTDIKGGEAVQYVSVIVPGEPINPPLNASLHNTTLTWSAPEMASLGVAKYYIYSSGVKVDSVGASRHSYTVDNPDGIYAVAAAYNYKGRLLVSEKSNTASNPFIIDRGDNKIITLSENSLVIPNAVTHRYNNGTIEFWIKPKSLASGLNRMGSEENGFFISVSASGQLSAGWSANNSNDYASTAAASLKAGRWYHVAVVVKGSELTIYVDGMKKKSTVSQNNSGLPALGDFVIGLEGGVMNASLDEFRIWQTARTMAEIYGGKDDVISNPASLTDLIAYMPMDLIENEGELKVREYALANHAYFANQNHEQATDASILKGSKLSSSVDITGVADTILAGAVLKYSAQCPISTTSWEWLTPGAENARYTSQAPYIKYSNDGTYTITLNTVQADGTKATATKDIVVLPAELPKVDFETAETEKNTGEAFSFVNRSTGVGTSYTWTLDGAQTPTLRATNATAIYDVPGTYTVTLTGTNTSGSVSKSQTITVLAAPPTPEFSVSPTGIYLGETTYLVDKSHGTPSECTWLLTNNKHNVVIRGQNSSFKPASPGIYDVTLTAANEVGQKSLTKKRLLCVSNADAKNALSFTGSEEVVFDSPVKKGETEWTFDWWMNPAQYTGAGGFYLDNEYLRMAADKVGAYKISFAGKTITSAKGYVVLNEWHHYAVAYKTGKVTLFRDGVVWEADLTTLPISSNKWEGKMAIGDSETPFKGLIDEVRVWNKRMSDDFIKTHANQPIDDPTQEEHLVLYYNFNQGQGNVTDFSSSANPGERKGFGPDGDAWPLTLGVFTLDLTNETEEPEDVTSQYLTNYKAPFLSDKDKKVTPSKSSAYAVKTGTEDSKWQLRNTFVNPDNEVVTGVYIDGSDNSKFYVTTSFSGFNTSIENHRAFQTVTLPAGKYNFSHTSSSRVIYDMVQTMTVATAGSELSDNSNYTNALAYKSIADGQEIEFVLSKETEVSLGMLYNIGSYDTYIIDEFKLLRSKIEILEADGETSVYESIDNGKAAEAYGREGGIMIASKERKTFKVYNIAGQCVFNDEAQGVHFLPFDKGIYIVNGIKVIVK